MTIEQLKKIDWLNRAFRADQKINALIAVQKQNKSLACRCTATYSSDGSTPGSHTNSQEAILHKICDDSIKFNQMIDYLADVRNEIFSAISAIGDDELETVLLHHFLAYKTWEQTAECMGYDVRTIRRKKIKAIDKMSLNVRLVL